jgi:hypothetical protein
MVILNTKLAGKTPRADSNLSWVSGTLENPTIVDREVDQCIQEESSIGIPIQQYTNLGESNARSLIQ